MILKRMRWIFVFVICFSTWGVILLCISSNKRNGIFETNERVIPIHVTSSRSSWKEQLAYQATLAPISGHKNIDTKFLTIGISTVYRIDNYLQKTLESFINESTSEERKDAVIVLYLADTDPEKKDMQLKIIQDNFQIYLDSGFIQVIESSSTIYPPMDFALTKRTFNDSVDRIIWRTKQVIDFAFLFSYAKNISNYYLVAEDDIITSNQYISAIRDFIYTKIQQRWTALEFSKFLGIGLLFHNRDLTTLTELLIMFHQYQPVDLLMRQFIKLQIPDKSYNIRRIPSIFQHIGKKSTLPNKTQKTIDDSFGLANRRFKNQNPSAELYTSMAVYMGFTPDYPYKPSPGYFWGIPEKLGELFDIVFIKPLNISRIVILTGIKSVNENVTTLKDYILDGDLSMSDNCIKEIKSQKNVCIDFQKIDSFKHGEIDFQYNLVNVQSLRIKLGSLQKTWVIIREIEIFKSYTSTEVNTTT